MLFVSTFHSPTTELSSSGSRISRKSDWENEHDIEFEKMPHWCKYIKQKGNIENNEMLNVFNCGYGFLLIISNEIKDNLHKLNFDFEIVGKIL